MSAFVLRGKSNSHIFTIDRGIVARENASDNVNILDQDYAQNLGILLDRSEVAGALNVIRYAVYKMIEREQIPSIKFGRLVHVKEHDPHQIIYKFRRRRVLQTHGLTRSTRGQESANKLHDYFAA